MNYQRRLLGKFLCVSNWKWWKPFFKRVKRRGCNLWWLKKKQETVINEREKGKNIRHVMGFVAEHVLVPQTFVAWIAPSKAVVSLVHVSVRGFVLRFSCFLGTSPCGIWCHQDWSHVLCLGISFPLGPCNWLIDTSSLH